MNKDVSQLDPVLVLGGCGGLGRHIVEQLLKEGHATQVTAFDLNPPTSKVDGMHYVQGNLANEKDVQATIQKVKPRTIFHTVSPKMMQTPDNALFDSVNIDGTRNLLNALKVLTDVKFLIYTSSSSVIHDNQSNLVEANEELPLCLEPQQPEHYTHTKAIAETLIVEATGQNGLYSAILRPTTLFGEYDTLTVPYMVELAKAGQTKFQIGDNTNPYDFTYTGNLAHAEILAAQALAREAFGKEPIGNDKKVNGEAFFISNDEHWTFWALPRAIGAAAGYPIKEEDVWHIPIGLYYTVAVVVEWAVWLTSFGQRQAKLNRKMLKFTTMTRTFDISKAKNRLGYLPKIGMQDGINRSVEWYLDQISAGTG